MKRPRLRVAFPKDNVSIGLFSVKSIVIHKTTKTPYLLAYSMVTN